MHDPNDGSLQPSSSPPPSGSSVTVLFFIWLLCSTVGWLAIGSFGLAGAVVPLAGCVYFAASIVVKDNRGAGAFFGLTLALFLGSVAIGLGMIYAYCATTGKGRI